MFVTEATMLLPFPPHVVDPLIGRLAALPRWCAGLRRARRAAELTPCGPDACALLYVARDVRLALDARTLERAAGRRAVHAAAGDGVTFTWTLTLARERAPGGGAAPLAPAGDAGDRARVRRPADTRLHVRLELAVDPDHPTAAYRASLYRQVARRVPGDLARLDALLARRAAVAAPGAGVASAASVLPFAAVAFEGPALPDPAHDAALRGPAA